MVRQWAHKCKKSHSLKENRKHSASAQCHFNRNTWKLLLLWAVAPTPYGAWARAATFTNGWARGHREYRKTANKKLTKLYCPSRKRSPKRPIVLLEPKKVKGYDHTQNFRRFSPDRCPPPSFQFVRAPLVVGSILNSEYCSKELLQKWEFNAPIISVHTCCFRLRLYST